MQCFWHDLVSDVLAMLVAYHAISMIETSRECRDLACGTCAYNGTAKISCCEYQIVWIYIHASKHWPWLLMSKEIIQGGWYIETITLPSSETSHINCLQHNNNFEHPRVDVCDVFYPKNSLTSQVPSECYAESMNVICKWVSVGNLEYGTFWSIFIDRMCMWILVCCTWW